MRGVTEYRPVWTDGPTPLLVCDTAEEAERLGKEYGAWGGAWSRTTPRTSGNSFSHVEARTVTEWSPCEA